MHLDHYFKGFSFGDASQRDNINANFADYPEHTRFDLVSKGGAQQSDSISFEPSETHNNYYKFIKLVPHIFLDYTKENSERDFESYSYSLT